MNIALTKNAYKLYGQNQTIPKGELSLKDISNILNVTNVSFILINKGY